MKKKIIIASIFLIAVNSYARRSTVIRSTSLTTATTTTASVPASCSLNGQTIASGQTVNAYKLRTAPTGIQCVPEARTCNNGVLSGSNPYLNCSANDYVAGFKVNIVSAALYNANLAQAVDRLQTRLEEVNGLSAKLAGLKFGMQFWLTDSKFQTAAATYNPSAQWLINNGRDPALAKGVEIISLDNFLNWNVPGDQPMMIVHEMAHAYHDQVLGANAQITAAYQNAKASGIYNSVHYGTLSGPLRVAYAMNNEQEYFAELTEAYFGTNDFYPFTRDQLKTFDPVGYQLMLDIWF